MDEPRKTSFLKTLGLIWILIECNLVAGNIFGLASLFSELPRYGIYQSECTSVVEVNALNRTSIVKQDCSSQVKKYQLAFALGIAFYNLPAVLFGVISDYVGPRSLKLLAMYNYLYDSILNLIFLLYSIFHLIGWLSLGFAGPGYDWLLLVHTIFISLSGISDLLASFSISSHFSKSRGLVTALISGSQITGTIWYAIFQILIERGWISLPTLSFIWASFAVLMFGSALLFLDWPFNFMHSTLKSKPTKIEVKTTAPKDSLITHLTNRLFIVVTLYLSCLLYTISLLPVIWYPWLSYLTNNNADLTNRYTFWFNMIAALGIFVAPLCGFIVDFKAYRGYSQKMLNISILQTLTWICCISLSIVALIPSIYAALIALIMMLLSRTLLVAGSQALIATVFPPRFIGSLLGVMWTTAGLLSFGINGLVSLGKEPEHLWRPWTIVLILCLIMGGHICQVWGLYYKSRKQKKSKLAIPDEEEMKKLKSSNEN